MYPRLNDAATALVVPATRPLAAALRAAARREVRSYAATQAALARRYALGPADPVLTWGPALEARVEAFAARTPGTRWATTSGTTGAPKRLAYPPARLRSFRRVSWAIGVQAHAHFDVRRAGFLVLSAAGADDSFASLVLARPAGAPPWLTGLVEPGRWLTHPAVATALARYGLSAARLWLLALTDPGLLYSTNPSTLAGFLADVYGRWDASVALVRAVAGRDAGADALDPDTRSALDAVVTRAGGAGARRRLAALAEATRPPPVDALAPGLRGFVSWDGGYTRPFVDAIRRFLPAARYVHLPMFSMSTETLETVTYFDGPDVRFLPLAPDVLYELLPVDAPDTPEALLRPGQLEVGREYTLVASDPYGLRRYQTEDVFECVGWVDAVPDLRFRRRRGLAWSFTGEKLTGAQCAAAQAQVVARHPALAGTAQLACFPSWPADEALPRYRLVVAWLEAPPLGEAALRDAGAALDAALAATNAEYAAKRSSGRLAAPDVESCAYEALAARLDPRTRDAADRARHAWESQFKLAPLFPRRWEEVRP